MKIIWKQHKTLPDVQYIAKVKSMPAAGIIDKDSPAHEIKVTKERLERMENKLECGVEDRKNGVSALKPRYSRPPPSTSKQNY